MIRVHFRNIRNQIKRELNRAKKDVRVAVYWFTNHELLDLLIHKVEKGLNVELIISLTRVISCLMAPTNTHIILQVTK